MTYKYFNSDMKRIQDSILKSENSKSYFFYKSNTLILHSSSEDDWNYCLLISKYINPKQDIKLIGYFLRSFLMFDRYLSKSAQNTTYLDTTIGKLIWYVFKSDIIGSLYNSELDQLDQIDSFSTKMQSHNQDIIRYYRK
uniref:Uncharacterized protein n=1 Tax=Gracilaria salicornia TaxID=172968 RepID=W8DVY3_9FLOR|nr:hypothetical protein [Gracilaria salicornia]AHH24516.1 hypothetical protein [Gracilaria salicornia]UAD87712.1 hypothetical protein [Gracilaria salicornia]